MVLEPCTPHLVIPNRIYPGAITDAIRPTVLVQEQNENPSASTRRMSWLSHFGGARYSTSPQVFLTQAGGRALAGISYLWSNAQRFCPPCNAPPKHFMLEHSHVAQHREYALPTAGAALALNAVACVRQRADYAPDHPNDRPAVQLQSWTKAATLVNVSF